MNYFMLDGKKIEMSDETAKSLRESQALYVPNKIVFETGSAGWLQLRFGHQQRLYWGGLGIWGVRVWGYDDDKVKPKLVKCTKRS